MSAAERPSRRPERGSRPSADPARIEALRLLVALEESGAPASGPIERTEGGIAGDAPRSFFRALVSETLRHRARIDHLLEGLIDRRRLNDLPVPIRNALRVGVTQLLVLDGVPPHAAVHETVALAALHGHRGTAGLVNAVLRRVAAEGRARWDAIDAATDGPAAARLALQFSHPEWLVSRWLLRWGEDRTRRVLEWNHRRPDYWLRLRPGAPPPPGAVPGWIPGTARLPEGSRPAEMPGFAEGDWTVQDGSGILVGLLCGPVRGRVLDLCAAPGTKTGHLRERAEPEARLVAMDISPGRLRRLRRGLARFAAGPPVFSVAADAVRIPVRPPWDGVLLDAPCSNLGVLRRRVDLKWRVREEEIGRLAELQRRLLGAAAVGGARGSWLVYSVCTTEPEETEGQRSRFLREHPDWIPAALPGVVPPAARRREGELLLLPGELETDGAYAFVVRRVETT